MPAVRQPPTLDQFLEAYAAAVRADGGPDRNVRRGSGHDRIGGPAALLWARQGLRDRDIFRECYISTARRRLEALVRRRYGIPQIKATYGSGTLLIQRLAGGTDGTIYTGTRILARVGPELPLQYAVLQDTPVDASALIVPVPIRATRIGAGVALNAGAGALSWGDSVFDPTFAPISLMCADGTDDEAPEAYVARARQNKKDNRPGYKLAIENACKAVGAANVVVLDADTFGDAGDFGITHVYVADAGYSTPTALLDACAIAVDKVHVGGCDVQVRGMAITPLSASLTVTLWDAPSAFDQVLVKRNIVAALLAEFARRPEFWVFKYGALQGAVVDTSEAIQSVAITTTPGEPSAAFVATLPRYTLAGTAVTVTLQGPQ